MVVIQYFENNTFVLSQLITHIPLVNENIKIKGRKGKVMSVHKIAENLVHAHVIFEEIKNKQTMTTEIKKKK